MSCVFVCATVTGVSAGLGEFVENSDGVPEVEVLSEDGGELREVSLFRAEAMRWLDLCIGKLLSPWHYTGYFDNNTIKLSVWSL